MVIDPVFYQAGYFFNELVVITVEPADFWGPSTKRIINKQGEFISNITYNSAGVSFLEGFRIVKENRIMYGIIDKTGVIN